MTPKELEPYLVMRSRTMLFENAVMTFCGIPHIPTFDEPDAKPKKDKPKGLGDACQGAKIDKCMAWLQERAPKRTVEGKEIQMIVTEDQLAEVLCRVCKKG